MPESVISSKVEKIEIEKIIPTPGRVIVVPDYLKSKKIIIPDKAMNRQQATTGKIVAIGDFDESTGFEVGDTVFFSRYGGAEIILTDEDGKEDRVMVLNFGDIFSYIKGK